MRFLAVHGQPTRANQHLALGLERFAGDARDARREQVFGRRVEHRQEALDDQVVELRFELVQAPRPLQRRDDGKVIRDLAVVENSLVRLDPLALEDVARKRAVGVAFAQRLDGALDGGQIVLRQRTRVGTRVRQDLVLFVERLRQRKGGARRKTKASIGVALQAREVVEQWRDLGRRLRLLGDRAGLAGALAGDGARFGFVPEPFRARVGVILRLAKLFIEPTARVLAGCDSKRAQYFPVIARLKGADPFLALDQDC